MVANFLEEVVPMNYPYERSLVREYLPSLALGMFLVALLTFIFTFLGLNKIAVPYTLASRGTTIL